MPARLPASRPNFNNSLEQPRIYQTNVQLLAANSGERTLMKQNLFRASITLLALTGTLAYAQRRQPPDPAEMVQHRVNFLTEELNLSPAQQQQATTIFTN